LHVTDDTLHEEPRKLFRWIQRQTGLSRRKAQELIAAGEVSVGGRVVHDPYAPIEGEGLDQVTLRGHPLPIDRPEPRIYRYYKPAGVLSSHDDPHSGNTVGRVLRSEGFVGYTWAGRLDRDAEGLLVLSNDGDLVNAFTHPRYEVEKVYRVWTHRPPDPAKAKGIFERMRAGIVDEGETLRILDGRFEGRPAHAVVRLGEGRKHEVKRLFRSVGLDVRRLLRVRIGPIELHDLKPGEILRLDSAAEQAAFAFVRKRLEAS